MLKNIVTIHGYAYSINNQSIYVSQNKIEVFHVKCILDKPVDLHFTGFIAINSSTINNLFKLIFNLFFLIYNKQIMI